MVRVWCRQARALFLALPFVLSAAAKDVAEYRLGDPVTEDIITPVALMVVDPAATEALKQKEAQRIPVVFRHDKSAAAFVEVELRETFSQARSNFVRLMHSSFHHTRLEAPQLPTEQFSKLIASFKRQNKTFPLSRQLAEDWALGEDGLAEQILLSERLRQAMEQPIRYDNLTNAPKIGSQVRLVAVQNALEPVTVTDIMTRGENVPRTNLLTLSRARLALREGFTPEEEDAAKFAARCLRENCFVEAEFTQVARARHTEALFVADNYQPGQIVARAGQLVDRKIMAALSQIQEKTVAGRLQQQVAIEKVQAAQIRESNRLLVGGLIGVASLLLLVLAWFAFRSKPPTSLLPAVTTGATASLAEAGWQQRALAAEEKVARTHDAIRSGVMTQLKEKVVSSLVTQRSEMLEAQHAAAAEMAELERRLNELHAPLQDRLRAYENRIADLEKALAVKGEENRELIRAKIELMRKQLEITRTGSDLQFN
jgi:hypothetical protein